MPRVSVIIPTYNRGDLIARSIDSVLDQTYEDYELLVVDDGSTDHTQSVVEQYSDDRITYIAHSTNQGASAARNTGIEHAEGEYLAFLDSDDVWAPRKLDKQVTELDERPPEWVAVYCGVEIGDTDTVGIASIARSLGLTRLEHTEGAEGGADLIKAVLKDELHTSAGSTLLVKTPVVEAVDGFDESFKRFQDPEFLIRVLRQGKLAYVPEPLVRRYDTGRPHAALIEASDRRYLSKFSDTVTTLERRGHDIRGVHHRFLARFYLEDGEFREALKHARHATAPTRYQLPGLVKSFTAGVKTKWRDTNRATR